MFVGHLAIGLAITASAPRTPALPIMVGVGVIDIVDGLLTVIGVDRIVPNLTAGPYLFFDLVFIDWDHSLLMALVLSLVWGALFLRRHGLATAAIAAAAAASHWLADLPVHDADLAAYPYAAAHFGFGLWGKWGTGAWVLEAVLTVVCIVYAWIRYRARGVRIVWPMVILVALLLVMSPWASPMYAIAQLPSPAAVIVAGCTVALGFLVPGLVLSRLLTRAERRSADAPTPAATPG